MIILGAGLAGLSAAYHGGGVVYERDAAIGGHSRSKKLDGFVFDEGIHVLQTKNAEILKFFDGLGLKFQEHARSGYVYSHGICRPYPLQVNTAGLPWRLRLECIWTYLRTARTAALDSQPMPRNYEEWLNNTLGTGFTRHFLGPYARKFWTVPPAEMTHDWAVMRVPKPKWWTVIKGAVRSHHPNLGTHVQFRYPVQGGFGAMADAFAPHIRDIRLRKEVVRLDGKARRVSFADGEEVTYTRLISTLPLPDLVRLMTDVPAEVLAAAARLRYNSLIVINLGIDRPGISARHWIHFPEPEISFFRISFPSNFAPGLAPRGTSSVSAEVAYSDWAPVDKSQIVDRIVDDLHRVGVLRKRDRIVLTDTIDIKYAYVIYDHNRKESVRTIHDYLGKHEIVPCGRYGRWAYLWSDEAVLSGRKAAELAARRRQAEPEGPPQD